MSNILGGLFGGSQQQNQSTSTSTNQAYPYLQGALSGNVGNGGAAGNQIANMLGLNGGPAQNQGFTNWQNSTGYQFGKQQGLDSITGNAATAGTLNSGGALKAIQTYGTNYGNTQYGNYNNMLQQLLQGGNTSAGILGQAGYQSNSQSTGSGSSNGPGGSAGIGQLINKLPQAAASAVPF